MSTTISASTRIRVREPVTFFLLASILLILFPVQTANAAEKRFFEDVVVGPDETPGSVSTVVGDIEVRGKVGGDVKSDFGDIEVYEPVGGTVDADFGDVVVAAPIGGDLDVGHGEVEWKRGGRVGGDLYCPNCAMGEVSNAQVGGQMKFGMNSGFNNSSERSGVLGLISWFFASLVFVAVSVLAAVLVPRPVESSARKIEESAGRSLLVGLASVPAAVLLAVVLGLSVVGIPLLLLAAPAYLAFVFFGAVVAAYFIGRRVLFATGRYHGGNALAATIGALLLAAVYLIPFVGSLILYALALLGAGGTILALISRRRAPAYPASYET